MIISEIIKLIKESDNIIILSHTAPDGDSLGSSLALYNSITSIGKEAEIVIDDEVPVIYRFLKSADKISCVDTIDKFDLVIVLDSSEIARIGKSSKYLTGKNIINIDHHISNTNFGTLNMVRPNAAATAEIVYQIIKKMNIKIDKEIAQCLYVGIVTDTGKFQYNNTTFETHQIASELLKYGVDSAEIFRLIYQNITKAKIKLIGHAINYMEFYCDEKISVIVLTKEQFYKSGAKDEDTEGIIDFARDINTVELALLFRESKDGNIKISFRSKDNINVNLFAGEFGGGGHKSAAGATVSGDILTVKKNVIDKAFGLFR
ncbi:MAG: bifunctional oligoribonuclease/PAP phosphatase NrnA [Firmicutes bacterium]|nr:bifunctional oligoribonuclease/PAP phosphatase NrnA [Bacillota bacterium]